MSTPNSNPQHEPENLLQATNLLRQRVESLTKRLNVSQRQNAALRRQGRRTFWLTVVGIIALVSVSVFGYVQWHRVTTALEASSTAIKGNTTNALQGCRNSNESREANVALWNVILGFSKASNHDPKVAHSIDTLLAWIGVLYQDHDCHNLDKVYKIPPPPNLSAP